MSVDEVFDHPAFAKLKSGGAPFAVVRPRSRDLIWANAAAAAFWNGTPEMLQAALFGPPGRGWLGTAMSAVVPGRSPQMFRIGLAPGLAMRGSMVLARAIAGSDGHPVVGFALPGSGAGSAKAEDWRRGAAPASHEEVVGGSAPETRAPSPESAPYANESEGEGAAGSTLARRSQIAVLRDRLAAAADGAATLRFLWRTDSRGILTQIDERLAGRLGAPLTIGSEPFPEAVARFDAAAARLLGEATSARATWSGIAIRLPVAGGAAVVPTVLSGSPVFGRDRGFEGFRGFGIVDLVGLEAAPRAGRSADAAAPTAPTDYGDPGTAASGTPADPAPVRDAPVPDLGEIREIADEAPNGRDGAEPTSLAASSEVADVEAAARQPLSAKVVDLRSFQAVRAGPPTIAEAPSPEAPVVGRMASEPASPSAAAPTEAEPVSDQMAFLALGAALRAQIGDDISVAAVPRKESDPSGDLRRSAPAPMEALGSGVDATETLEASAAADLLDRLPVPLLVLRDGEPVFANTAAARALDFDTPGDLLAAGARLEIEPAPPGLTLRNGRGDPVAMAARATPVDWKGRAAVLWLLDPSPVETSPRATDPLATPRPDDDDRLDPIDWVDDAVVLLDGEGRIRRLNERGRGWFDGDAVGESVTALLAPESRAPALQLLEEARARGEERATAPLRREILARSAEGVAMPMLLTLGRLGAAGFYATLRDVSALRHAERGEARSRSERERDAGRLPDLLARVSHEIRTPLNAILGFAEVMMDERFGPLGSPRYRDYLKDIHASGTQVVTLVGDLLDLSRIEAGRLDLDVGAVDVNKIVAEIVAQMQPEANRGRVIVRTSLVNRIPSVMADERSTRQIVQHLLSNAVKFNEPGGQVIVSTAQDESGAVLLRIRDTGVGMTEAEIAAALEPFHDVSPPRPANGNGLGLPLARALVGANGASLSIRSRPREGTLVEVSFPAAPPEEARRPA